MHARFWNHVESYAGNIVVIYTSAKCFLRSTRVVLSHSHVQLGSSVVSTIMIDELELTPLKETSVRASVSAVHDYLNSFGILSRCSFFPPGEDAAKLAAVMCV